jgi:hypothetical protein
VPLELLHKDHSNNKDDTDIRVSELPAQLLTLASKFPETQFILCDPTNTSMNEQQVTAITLSLSKLLEFLNTSFKCCSCNSAQAKKFTLERYGIASNNASTADWQLPLKPIWVMILKLNGHPNLQQSTSKMHK